MEYKLQSINENEQKIPLYASFLTGEEQRTEKINKKKNNFSIYYKKDLYLKRCVTSILAQVRIPFQVVLK